jgi:hypothetical protein
MARTEIGMAKSTPPKDRADILVEVRKILAENFDCGLAIVSWEEQGLTSHMEVKFGNEYALQSLARDADEILWPVEDDEEEAEA